MCHALRNSPVPFTTEFQLLHTPAAFHAERIAWRSVIYLNLVRSIRRILDAISPDSDQHDALLGLDSDSVHTTSSAGDVHAQALPPPPPLDPQQRQIATEKHAYYSARLAALVDLEARLMRMLGDADEDVATRLDDGSAPGWSFVPALALAAPRPEISVNTSPHTAPPTPSARSPLTGVAGLGRGGEMSVRPTSNWKKALGLGGSKLKGASPGTGELLGWWEDPADPVHVLSKYSSVMVELWDDQWVKARLRDRRIRLEESSGL